MYQQKDHTNIPDRRRKEGRDKKLKRNEQSYVQLPTPYVPAGGPRTTQEGKKKAGTKDFQKLKRRPQKQTKLEKISDLRVH